MKGFSTELKVGIFSIIVAAILGFMTFKVGGLEWGKTKGYTVFVYFNNIAGLDKKTKVRVAGVEAGEIERIDLAEGRARLMVSIYSDIKLYENASAMIRSTGLLGDKFLEIKIGSPDQPLMKDGDTIKNVSELVDIDELARNLSNVSRSFTKVAESINEVIGTEESKDQLSQTIRNLKEISVNLNRTITVNDQKLRDVLDNINNLTASINTLIDKNSEPISTTIANLKDFSGTMKTSAPELVDNLNKATRELKAMVEENRPGIKSTVDSFDTIAKNIEKGEGSLGKLVKDDRLYESINKAAEGVNRSISAVERFRTFITFQADYLTKPKDSKGHFYVTLQPRPDKYYILGVVGDPVASVTTKTTVTTPGTTVTEDEIKKEIQFTAQFAKRFGDAALRVGLTENTFGLGADYFLLNDKAKITADIWDFSRDEEKAKNPHLRVGMDYFLFKNLFISAGADNILNKKWRGGYVGMGLRFEDEDFKYLLGTLPKIPTK